MSRVQVSSHPLVAHHVVALRDPTTKPPAFRRTVEQITRLLAVEATTTVPTNDVSVPTPLGEAKGRRIAERIAIVPILRAGLGMAEGLLELIPDAEVWHIGLYRDEATLRPQEYYNKLPATCGATLAIVVDPMLAGLRGGPTSILYGSPETVARQIKSLADLGFTDIIARSLVNDQRQTLDSIERMAEVRERVRDF